MTAATPRMNFAPTVSPATRRHFGRLRLVTNAPPPRTLPASLRGPWQAALREFGDEYFADLVVASMHSVYDADNAAGAAGLARQLQPISEDGSPEQTPRWMRARHEAAHAVVGWMVGLTPTRVGITIDGYRGGRVRFGESTPRLTLLESCWQNIQAFVAGSVVERDGGFWGIGPSSDGDSILRDAIRILCVGRKPADYHGPLSIDGLVLEASRRARQIVADHDASICAIAALLEARAELGFHDIADLLPARETRMQIVRGAGGSITAVFDPPIGAPHA